MPSVIYVILEYWEVWDECSLFKKVDRLSLGSLVSGDTHQIHVLELVGQNCCPLFFPEMTAIFWNYRIWFRLKPVEDQTWDFAENTSQAMDFHYPLRNGILKIKSLLVLVMDTETFLTKILYNNCIIIYTINKLEVNKCLQIIH